MNELFSLAEIVRVCPPPPIPPNSWPYRIVAFWPRDGGRWVVHSESYSSHDGEKVVAATKQLVERGWTYIHVIKLPEYKTKNQT